MNNQIATSLRGEVGNSDRGAKMLYVRVFRCSAQTTPHAVCESAGADTQSIHKNASQPAPRPAQDPSGPP